jgi:hypothetical protein
MKVLLLNQCFYPDVVATAQHGWDLARRLTRDGHEVTAIASRSIYGTAGASLPPTDRIEGIEVRRVASSRYGRASLFARAVDFVGFYARATVAALALVRHDVGESEANLVKLRECPRVETLLPRLRTCLFHLLCGLHSHLSPPSALAEYVGKELRALLGAARFVLMQTLWASRPRFRTTATSSTCVSTCSEEVGRGHVRMVRLELLEDSKDVGALGWADGVQERGNPRTLQWRA